MTIYHVPKSEHPMDEIYVALSVDNDGSEGIVAMVKDNSFMPVVFGNKSSIEGCIPLLKDMAKQTGRNIKLYKFKKSEVLQEIYGNN